MSPPAPALKKALFTSPMFVLVASLLVLIAAGINCNDLQKANLKCEKENAWAVAVSAVSLGFVVIYYLACLVKRDLADSVGKWLSIFLFIWWIPGAFVNTFPPGPFVFTGNGYFGSWVALAASFLWVIENDFEFNIKFGSGSGSAAKSSSSTAVEPLSNEPGPSKMTPAEKKKKEARNSPGSVAPVSSPV